MPSASASSSIACSKTAVPSITPGALNAFWARRFVFAKNVIARTSAQRYSVRAGMRTGICQPP